MSSLKKCTRCQRSLGLDSFRRRRAKDGTWKWRSCYCKDCHREMNRTSKEKKKCRPSPA